MNPVVMKNLKNRFAIRVLIAVVGLMLAGRVTAQTFTVLHTFTGGTGGANPFAGLILSGGTLFGTTGNGGSSGHGTLFAINIDGSGFTNVYSFTATSGSTATNTDGANPDSSLILSDNTLYGTARYGGSLGHGTVFAVNTNGTSFTNMHNFTEAYEVSGLILSSNILYGTTDENTSADSGTIFAVNTNGTGFTNLYSFSVVTNINHNSDGAYPIASLILSGSTLYGTAAGGGASGAGTIFALNSDGTGFTNLHNFVVAEGSIIDAGLVLLGNTLYGAAQVGGSGGSGTLFAINTNGTGFTNLHSFTSTSGPSYTNSDGANPIATLISSGNTLFGTTWQGGGSGIGTIFAINTDGTGFTTLHSFTGGDGARPVGGLILSSNILYGTAYQGGSSGNGTVFSIFVQPKLTIIPSGPYVVLTWPTNYTGFTLQSTTNLVSPVWATNSQGPVVIGGQNIVVNTISGAQQFYRLSQ